MELVYYPDEFLDRQVQEVDLDNPGFDPIQLKDEMTDFMLENGGIGLAANQIGLDAKVFVMGDSKANSTICINPTVLQHTSNTTVDREGCLSFPGVILNVKRPKEILVQYHDHNLEVVTQKVSGYSARCYLHELDHVLGITFKDRVSPMKWERAMKKVEKIKRQQEKSLGLR